MDRSRFRSPRAMNILFVALLLLVLQSPNAKLAHAGENVWTWAGMTGGISDIAVDPSNPEVVYVRAKNGTQIWKTANGGSTWTKIFPPFEGDVFSMAMAPSSPNVLYASARQFPSGSHIYRSVNGGGTWEIVGNSIYAAGMAVSPVNWQEVYTSAGGKGYYRSVDGGLSWEQIGEEIPTDAWDYHRNIVIAPSAPHILVTGESVNFPRPLYKSSNRGTSWSPLGNFAGSNMFIQSIVFDPKNSNTLYVGTPAPGPWKSTNGGSSWQLLGSGLQVSGWQIVIDPNNTQVLYAAGTGGVYKSTDGGASWTPLTSGVEGQSFERLAIASADPLVLYAGSGAGLWKLTRTTIQDYGITINDAALFTNQTAVTLTLTAPAGTTEMQISNDGGFGGAPWQSFVSPKPWTITAYGSNVIPRTVYSRFRTSGQTSAVYQDDIILDQTAPTGAVEITGTVKITGAIPVKQADFSLIVPSGTYTVHLPLVGRNYLPGARQVGLSLSVTDDVSGVDSMLLSNDVSFTGAQWQSYVRRLNWYVKDRGTTTVYVKYRDRAGNESQVYSVVTVAP